MDELLYLSLCASNSTLPLSSFTHSISVSISASLYVSLSYLCSLSSSSSSSSSSSIPVYLSRSVSLCLFPSTKPHSVSRSNLSIYLSIYLAVSFLPFSCPNRIYGHIYIYRYIPVPPIRRLTEPRRKRKSHSVYRIRENTMRVLTASDVREYNREKNQTGNEILQGLVRKEALHVEIRVKRR